MSEDPNFLFELGVEELPPNYVIEYIKTFKTLFLEQCDSASLPIDATHSQCFATPRRLALTITFNEQNHFQILTADPKKGERIERGRLIQKYFGPKVNSLKDKAAIGFARSHGLQTSELLKNSDGRVYCTMTVDAKPAKALLPILIEKTFIAFHKLVSFRPMRWGTLDVVFIRPVRWLVCLYGSKIFPLRLFGICADRLSSGHRFHSDDRVMIDSAQNYIAILKKNFVLADFFERQHRIVTQLFSLAAEVSADWVKEKDLLDEVTAITEWPCSIRCQFDPNFLTIPKAVLIASMQQHQKSFALIIEDQLQPYFITIANIDSRDQATLIRGNEVVMSARLSDARFFFDSDQQQPLKAFSKKNKAVVFQKQLGSIWDKTQRVSTLARHIGVQLNADLACIEQASQLADADLNTAMVYECPELQGIMGKIYALREGYTKAIADCIEQRYWPIDTTLPETLEATALALADRIDRLVGIFGIGFAPTGSNDPYSIRRAAIGVIRIIREKRLTLSLSELLDTTLAIYSKKNLVNDTKQTVHRYLLKRLEDLYKKLYPNHTQIQAVLDAVISSQSDDLFDLDERMTALIALVDTPNIKSVATSNKRLKNILDKHSPGSRDVDTAQFVEAAETNLWQTYQQIQTDLLTATNYQARFKALSHFAHPLENFFETVMVMVDNTDLKNNRLALLQSINTLFIRLADLGTCTTHTKTCQKISN